MRQSDYWEQNGDDAENMQGSAQGLEVRSQQMEALRQHQMRNWWWFSLALWLTIGSLSLWALRFEFQELNEYFTWAAVRTMFAFNRFPALGLGICFGLTVALLYAESRHILFGLSESEAQQITARLNKIQAQGPSHPQWKLIASASATDKQISDS